MNVLVFKDKELLQRLENPDRILRSTVNTVISTRLVTSRPLSGPPLSRQQSNRTELRSYSTSESEGISKPTSSLRITRQTSETRPRPSAGNSSGRPHSHCYTRTSPSPTFTEGV